jgi:hypothetical protein
MDDWRERITQCVTNKLKWWFHIQSLWHHGKHKCFEFEKSQFQIRSRNSILLNLIAALSVYISCYVNTTVCLPLPINYKLQKAQRSDECSVHTVIQDIKLKCELHVTVNVYRVACSLSDADSHLYTKQNIRVRAVFLMSVPLHNII